MPVQAPVHVAHCDARVGIRDGVYATGFAEIAAPRLAGLAAATRARTRRVFL